MSEFFVKAGQKAPTFCEMDEECQGEDMFVMVERDASVTLVGRACTREVAWCPVRNGSTLLQARSWAPAMAPREILAPADSAHKPADGNGWLNAGTPMPVEASDPAYHRRPITTPARERQAKMEYAQWLRDGRRLSGQKADQAALDAMNPAKVDAAKDIENGNYL